MKKSSLALLLGLLTCHTAPGAVFLTLSDTVGASNSVVITSGEAFDVTLTLTSDAELTSGLSYLLEALGAGAGYFRITARDLAASAFADLTTDDSIALSPPNALLDPTNDTDLGGLVSGDPNGIGSFRVAGFTIQSLDTVPVGSYTLSTNSVLAIDDQFDEIPLTAQATYQVTVSPVPEPGSTAVLLGIGISGLGWLRRRLGRSHHAGE